MRIHKPQQGVTLIELMIVVLVIAVLAAIVYPSYGAYVSRARVAEVKGQVLGLASALERYRAQNFSYAGATVAALMPELSANAHYTPVLTIGATNQSYEIIVRPKGSMAGKGAYGLDSAGRKCHNPNSDSGCVLTDTSSWD